MKDKMLACYGAAPVKPAPEDFPLKFTGHYIIGGNEETQETGGYWDTEEQAIIQFALQFERFAMNTQGKYLFVRRAPVVEEAVFGAEIKWRMIGRFSVAKLKGLA